MRGKVFDQRYGQKKPEKQLEPGKYTLLRMNPEEETTKRSSVASSGVGGGIQSARSRMTAAEFQPEPAKPKVYRVRINPDNPDSGWIDLSEAEYAKHQQAKSDREATAARQRKEHEDRIAKAARLKEEEAVRARREAWRKQDEAETLRKHREEQAKKVEQSLSNAAIVSAMEAMSATPLECERVGKLLRQNYGPTSLQLIPLWEQTLEKIRAV